MANRVVVQRGVPLSPGRTVASSTEGVSAHDQNNYIKNGTC